MSSKTRDLDEQALNSSARDFAHHVRLRQPEPGAQRLHLILLQCIRFAVVMGRPAESTVSQDDYGSRLASY
jgi:hypothetical protein